MKYQKICFISLLSGIMVTKLLGCCYMSCDPNVIKAYMKLNSYLNNTYSVLSEELDGYKNNVEKDQSVTALQVKRLNSFLKRGEIYLLNQKQITFEIKKLQKLTGIETLKELK